MWTILMLIVSNVFMTFAWYGHFKIQEVISLTVFTIIITVLFRGESFHWNHFAAFACLILAVFFVFLK